MLHGKSLGARFVAAGALLSLGVALLPERAMGAGGSAGAAIQLAEAKSAADRVNMADIDPALEARLDQAAATYKQLAAAVIATATANADKMVAALEAGDIQTARQAWTDARAAYQRCKVLTIKFPYVASGIDPRRDTTVGFRAIAAKLFTPGAPLPLAESQALADKMHTFQRVFAAEPVYAHGVIAGIGHRVGELGEGLPKDGEPDVDGPSPRDMLNEVEGIELAWNTIFAAAVMEKSVGVADRVQSELAEVTRLLSVALRDQLDVQGLETGFKTLSISVSDAVEALGWRPPRPEDAED